MSIAMWIGVFIAIAAGLIGVPLALRDRKK
jgi:hypothetical protein